MTHRGRKLSKLRSSKVLTNITSGMDRTSNCMPPMSKSMQPLKINASSAGGLCSVADAISLCGMAFGGVPVAWTTWITRTLPDQAESGGGLIVAAVQLAITFGTAAGGPIFDLSGAKGVFVGSALVLLLATTIIAASFRTRPILVSP